jgi:hypothetical protein
MVDEAEAIAFLLFKLHEVEKVNNRQEEEIAKLKREKDALFTKMTENFEKSAKEAQEKLKLGREKKKERRDSLDSIQKEERAQINVRTEKRKEELRLEQIKWEERKAGQLPE